jgi:copper chaperone CopZ
MKTKQLLLVISLIFCCLTANAQEKKDAKKKKEVVTFVVNMSCENCKAKIEKNVSWEKGVKDLRINLEKKTVTVTYDPQKITKEQLKKAIEKLEFSCEEKTDS